MKEIAVLASGRGSNFQALIDAARSGYFPGFIARLITDNPEAYAIRRAKDAGIPVSVLDFGTFPGKEEYEEALRKEMETCDPDLFVLKRDDILCGGSFGKAVDRLYGDDGRNLDNCLVVLYR